MASVIRLYDGNDNVIGEYTDFELELTGTGTIDEFILRPQYVTQDALGRLAKVEIIGEDYNFFVHEIEIGDRFPDQGTLDLDITETGEVDDPLRGFPEQGRSRAAEFENGAVEHLSMDSPPEFDFGFADFVVQYDLKFTAMTRPQYAMVWRSPDIPVGDDESWWFGHTAAGGMYWGLRTGGVTRYNYSEGDPSYNLNQWYNICFARKFGTGSLHMYRDGLPKIIPISNLHNYPAWIDAPTEIGKVLNGPNIGIWYGEEYELDNILIYDSSNHIGVSGFPWWTAQWFGDAYLDPCSPTTCGTWETDRYVSTQVAAPFWALRIQSVGTWTSGYRPAKIRFTMPPSPNATYTASSYSRNLASLLFYNNAYVPGESIEIDWSGGNDGFDISIGGFSAPFEVTNIEFSNR